MLLTVEAIEMTDGNAERITVPHEDLEYDYEEYVYTYDGVPFTGVSEGKQSHIEWRDGLKHGIWQRYYSNGQLHFVRQMECDVIVGEHKEWHRNGQLAIHGEYKGLDCLWEKEWDRKGRLVKQADRRPSMSDAYLYFGRPMFRSQNATFYGQEPDSADDHLRGHTIASCLTADFERHGWDVGDTDVWRDSGHVFSMERDGVELEIIVAPFRAEPDRWILQISPQRLPGMIRRFLFGATPSASPDDVFQCAVSCQRALTDHGFDRFWWCWDDLADSAHCESQPTPPHDKP